MCIYEDAIKAIDNSKTCKVIALSGGWEQSKAKEDWLKKLAESKDIERHFIVGSGYDKETNDIVLKRCKYLHDNGVKVRTLSCCKDHTTGVIIFDYEAFVGITMNGKTGLLQTDKYKHLLELNRLFKGAKKESNDYGKNK